MSAGMEQLLGKTLVSASVNAEKDRMTLDASDGSQYLMHHIQDCCESVSIEEIVGDLGDILGSPILQAEEATNSTDPVPDERYVESYTWTFYKLATIKGGVTIRWLGDSNGYYSESVDFEQTREAST